MICREFISKHVESIATKIDPELDIVEEIERQVKSFFFGWKVQNLLWPFLIERLRLGACCSCWTALMRSQEWLHSPGSFPPSLNVSWISLTPFKLEPKVQQGRHPHSPPVDPGDTKHNSLKSPCWSSGNLGWPTSSRSSCHCNEQTPHSDLPPGIILPLKERGVGYIPKVADHQPLYF